MSELAWPVRRTPNGDLVTVEPDSDQEVRQSVGLLLFSRVGERAVLPEYGTDDPTLVGVDAVVLVAQVQAAEPRASLAVAIEAVDAAHTQAVTVQVDRAVVDAGQA